jgi:hypothetical protein
MPLVLVEHGTIVGAAPKANMGDHFYLAILRTRQLWRWNWGRSAHYQKDYRMSWWSTLDGVNPWQRLNLFLYAARECYMLWGRVAARGS